MPLVTFDRAAVENAFRTTWTVRYADLRRTHPHDYGAWQCVVRAAEDVADIRLDGEPAVLWLSLTREGIVPILETKTGTIRVDAAAISDPSIADGDEAADLLDRLLTRVQDAMDILLVD